MEKYKQLKHYALAALLCLCFLGATASSFANNISIGRYLSVAAKPQNDQQRLLQQQIQIKFPQNILTIQKAVGFVLQFSGYRLADLKQMNHSARDMLGQPLPVVDKTFGPMTLEQGLTTLSGNAFYLLIDPIHRLVAFQVNPRYRNLYEKYEKPIPLKINHPEQREHYYESTND